MASWNEVDYNNYDEYLADMVGSLEELEREAKEMTERGDEE